MKETNEIGDEDGELAMKGTSEIDGQQSIEDTTEVKPHYKRNYFWCPIPDCTSGPVQKMTQHMRKTHKMDPAAAVQASLKKCRAPLEAIQMKTPNPRTRSSGLRDVGHFVKKMVKPSTKETPSLSYSTRYSPGRSWMVLKHI